jgi:hypothetical protein
MRNRTRAAESGTPTRAARFQLDAKKAAAKHDFLVHGPISSL